MVRRASQAVPSLRAVSSGKIVSRLARAWRCSRLGRVPLEVHPRLKGTLGRVQLRPLTIQLSPAVLDSPQRTEVIAHEAPHAALALTGKTRGIRPHGPEWRRLMALAGFPKAKAARPRACMPRPPKRSRARYEHRCPVCQTTRTAKRRVPEWRCAACVAAGLPGRLTIQTLRHPRGAALRHPEGAKRPKDLVSTTTRSFAPHRQTEGRSG